MKKTDNAFVAKAAGDGGEFLLWQVATLWQRGIKKALRGIKITHPQYVLLASLLRLSGQQESVTQINLSQHSNIDPMTTSAIISILQKKKLIERKKHKTDTRAKIITLSHNGIITARQAIKIIQKFDKAFFSSLGSKTKSFKVALLALLQSNVR